MALPAANRPITPTSVSRSSHNPTVVVLEEIATPGIPASRLFEAPASKGEQGCYLSFVSAHPKFTGLDCIEKICYSLTALDE